MKCCVTEVLANFQTAGFGRDVEVKVNPSRQ